MRLFKKKLSQNEKLLKNLEKYDKKKEIEQQESKILGQKQVKDTENQRKKINT
jgi:hypothetical protein